MAPRIIAREDAPIYGPLDSTNGVPQGVVLQLAPRVGVDVHVVDPPVLEHPGRGVLQLGGGDEEGVLGRREGT